MLKKKLDDYNLENKRFQAHLAKKTNQIKEQAEVKKLVKQLQVLKVEKDIQRAEAIQLIQVVDGEQYEKLEKACMPSLPMPTPRIEKTAKKLPFRCQTW